MIAIGILGALLMVVGIVGYDSSEGKFAVFLGFALLAVSAGRWLNRTILPIGRETARLPEDVAVAHLTGRAPTDESRRSAGLTSCEACGRKGLSKQAALCPSCGHPIGKIRERRRRNRIGWLGILCMVVGLFLALAGGGSALGLAGAALFILGTGMCLLSAVSGFFFMTG